MKNPKAEWNHNGYFSGLIVYFVKLNTPTIKIIICSPVSIKKLKFGIELYYSNKSEPAINSVSTKYTQTKTQVQN